MSLPGWARRMSRFAVVPAAEGREPRPSRLAGLTALAAAVGVALRVGALLDGRSLWMDEALLAWNTCGRSFAGLLRPLDLNQAAPIGFLMAEHLAVVALGPTEVALRLVPCLASIAALGLVYRICRANLDAEAAAFGVALAALAPALISYGAEAKQYAVDAAAALLVVDVAAAVLREGPSARRLARLAAAGAAAVWFSHPAVFVLAGAGPTVFVHLARRRQPRAMAAMVGVGACWAASFLVNYALSLRSVQANGFLNDFWQFAFLPFPPRTPGDVRTYLSAFLGLFDTMFRYARFPGPIPVQAAAVAAALAWLAGVVALARRGSGGLLALLLAPLAVATVAAMGQKYPLRGRMVLFDVGLNVVVIAAGVAAALRTSDGRGRALGRAFAAGLLLLAAVRDAPGVLRRPRPYGTRAVLEQVARSARPGDPIVVDFSAEPAWNFYRASGRIAGLDRLRTVDPGTGEWPPGPLKGLPRAWVLVETHSEVPDVRERRLMALLDRSGHRLESIAVPGAHADLYDMR